MVHIAIVLDKRGLPAGLITLEDLLEEITGDIRDEHDTGRIIMKNQEDGTFTALAKESLQRVAIELGAKLPYENFTSLGDLILDLFGRIPKKGEEITFQHLRFIIEEASRKRVIRVKIIKLKL
jgi:CBS domain containing-hemolysin-like protein